MASPLSAINAYTAAANAVGEAGLGASAAAKPAKGPDFAAMIEDAVGQASDKMAAAEQLTMAAATGKAELVDVVTAVAAAETTMETMLSVRDEVIRAYQEILRMPI